MPFFFPIRPKSHNICQQHACSNQCVIDRNKVFRYCLKHLCSNRRRACTNLQASGSRYCQECQCQVKKCLNSIDMSSNKFCVNHRCQNCQERRIKGFWCEQHVCLIERCVLSRVINSQYCEEHICSQSKCDNLRETKSLYCSKHVCQTKGCHHKGPLCKKHRCLNNKCKNRRQKLGKFCYVHTCVATDCIDKCLESGFCREHLIETFSLLKNNVKYQNAECMICYDQNIDTSLNCGHTGCRNCLNQINQCPICSEKITERRRIYLG